MFQASQLLHDRYQLKQRLGRTAPGRQTWLAQDQSQAGQLVVVKLLVFNSEFQWDDLKLFEREAQVLANLDHPQIPQYYDFFVADTADNTTLHWWALVQEFVVGDSLQDLLDRRYEFEPDQIRDIAADVLEILIYLHELSPPVLHRDIKPSNLILGEDNKVYLIDFGAVQDETKVTGMTFTVVGTIGYAPMEQFWGRSIPASDLYGLGSTLIHLCTGIAPANLPQKELRLQFADRMSRNSIAASWLGKMVEPAIEQRYRSARSAHQDLLHGMAKTGHLARPESGCMQIAINSEDLVVWPSAKTRLVRSVRHRHKPIRRTDLLGWILLCVVLISTMILGTMLTLLLISSLGIPGLMSLLFSSAFIVTLVAFIRIGTRPIPRLIRYGLRFSGRTFSINTNITSSLPSSGQTKPLVFDLVSTIQSVSAQDAMTTVKQPDPADDYWQIVIQAKGTHVLPWKLQKSECLWLVQEINDWIDQHQSN